MRAAGLILAAGASSRFGTPKALARLGERSLLEQVLQIARSAALDPIVVVLGAAAEQIEPATDWSGARVVRNPDPDRGLSSSLQVGLRSVAGQEPAVDVVVILLGDQPRTRRDVITALLGAAEDPGRPIVVPRYEGGGGANPLVLARSAFDLVHEATGDRGLGPIVTGHPELVREVLVSGSNRDVDTRADLAILAEEAWAERVRANREQVERLREVADGADFYRGVSSIFRADPYRTDDPVLAGLLRLVRPTDVVLDIGAGAGRYALPLALAVREVIALDPSTSMLDGLREGMDESAIRNIQPVQARWPAAAHELGAPPIADVALIAHVGYDIEAIGPFLDALERAAHRLCVAVLMDRSPASIAEPFWADVHDEPRIPLPALPAFVELLETRNSQPEVRTVAAERRHWHGREEVEAYLRQQTWVSPGGEKDRRLHAAIDRRAQVGQDGSISLATGAALRIGIVTWSPPEIATESR
ncbi:MAG TPA: NTP transferase domain-containing protein [Candidatus Limnocylindrales bacterium]